MQRRWLVSTALLCLLLVVTTLFASNRPVALDAVVERDGTRTVYGRRMGFFPMSRVESDPALHVSDDLRKQLRRLGLKVSPELESRMPDALRNTVTSLQFRYSLSGEVAGSPKDAINFFVRQVKGARRYPSPTLDQMSGTLADGRSEIDVLADSHGGRTWVDLGLTVLR